MLTEQGTVVALDPAGVSVAVVTGMACQSCQSQARCGQGVLTQSVPQKTVRFPLPVAMSLRVGDRVLIGVPAQAALKAALVLYLQPVLLTLLGAGLADAWAGQHNGWTVLGALLGLALGFWVISRYGQWHQHDAHYQARILAVLNPHASMPAEPSRLICAVAADRQDGG